MSRTINKFTGFGKKGTEITPEEINGYTNLQNIINKIDDNNILYFYLVYYYSS